MADQRREQGDGRDPRKDAQDVPRGPGRAALPEEARAWEALVATARRTVAEGLVVGTSGNVSVRVGETVLVTPSGVPYDRLAPDDITGVALDGRQVLGTLVPTSELPMHLAIHRSTDARAVVHTHAVHATAVSTLVPELPTIHYMSAALGGPVRVAPYATYGTDELAENMLRALADRTACLLQNHGTMAHGATLDQAYDRTAQLEWMCRLWLTASSVPGLSPTLLTREQLDEVGEKLKGYGQR
ncbi:class II aldolase/adducin family protein [Streptomyces gilvifuscus]|uniref:Class II aldolase/adducin family protein n=1 Tax=Streptomyces gilvifuscus TaxID=1550617 RepID=A0ABT5FT51_9ACTN|nr:class II aldolase/adducin family protein [Streptomyces gilvifuscus]MDC2955722.1 class II aldolase/adducin family protein [Streptomyces gilvifuscus]